MFFTLPIAMEADSITTEVFPQSKMNGCEWKEQMESTLTDPRLSLLHSELNSKRMPECIPPMPEVIDETITDVDEEEEDDVVIDDKELTSPLRAAFETFVAELYKTYSDGMDTAIQKIMPTMMPTKPDPTVEQIDYTGCTAADPNTSSEPTFLLLSEERLAVKADDELFDGTQVLLRFLEECDGTVLDFLAIPWKEKTMDEILYQEPLHWARHVLYRLIQVHTEMTEEERRDVAVSALLQYSDIWLD
ncbi:MAG: hypothetical protein SGARI_002398 [Bacillariaceae sp.]